jgi:hypothetical protein
LPTLRNKTTTSESTCDINSDGIVTDTDHGDFDANMDMTTDEISARDNNLNDDYTIKIDVPPSACVINHADNTELSDDNENQPRNQGQNPSTACRTFPTILKMIVGCVKGNIFDDSDNKDDSTNDVPHTPTMTEILEKAKQHHNIELDIQYPT